MVEETQLSQAYSWGEYFQVGPVLSFLAVCLVKGPRWPYAFLAAGPVLLTVNNTSQEKGKNLTLQEAICSHLFATGLWVCCSTISIFFCVQWLPKKINFLSFHYIICGQAVGSSESSKCSNMHLELQSSHNLLHTFGKNCSALRTIECVVNPDIYPQPAGFYMPYGALLAIMWEWSKPMQRQTQRPWTTVLGRICPLLPVHPMLHTHILNIVRCTTMHKLLLQR